MEVHHRETRSSKPWRWVRVRGRRYALRVGFCLIIGLLAFSTFQAYQIQASLSEETIQIYHAHVRQDDLITRLRRSLWLGSVRIRDYLIHPSPDVEQRFRAEVSEHKKESRELLGALDEQPALPRRASTEFRAKVEEFWSIIDHTPEATLSRTAAERYDYIQREIVPRRNAVGDLAREFTS